jgi:glutathione peroxidase
MAHVLVVLAISTSAMAADKPAEEKPAGPLQFTVQSIDGKEVKLADKYAGKVCLIVNVASKCSLTTQYVQLTALHKQYGEKGLAILAFPSNDFEQEEPGTNAEIQTFCKTTYGVEFDLFAKIPVKGPEQAPLYRFLTSKEANGNFGGEIEWNFAKFLVGRDGQVIARFKPGIEPGAPVIVEAIEAALAAKGSDEDEWEAHVIGDISGKQSL